MSAASPAKEPAPGFGPVPSIVPVHAAVPGRVRLKVAGLQASPAIKELLERGGRGAPGVSSVGASALTGNLLVHFEPKTSLDTIIEYLAALLRGDPVAAGRHPDAGPEWHTLSPRRVGAMLEVSADEGLSRQNARARLASTGPNVLQAMRARSSTSILLEQFQSLPVGMLLGAAAISILTGGALEAAAILSVVGINAAIGYYTESRAERTIRSLESEGPRTTKVMREGVLSAVPVRDIVPADILWVGRGDVVPADARLISADALTVSEAILTGESVPVSKTAATIRKAKLPLGSRSNMIYRGTMVTGGSARAIVVATGPFTQAGRIQRLVAETVAPETPIQRDLGNLGRRLGWMTIGACALLVLGGWLRGFSFLQMARSSLSVAVAAVPEGLPMVATTTLALGVEKLRRKGVLIRKLEAVETLAGVELVCFDKTGTLTLGQIAVETVRIGDKAYSINGAREPVGVSGPLRELLETSALCNDARIAHNHEGVHLSGSPTDSCLVQAALDAGVDVASLRRRFPITSIQHRTESSRFMVTHHQVEGRTLIAMKGSPDEVLRRCSAELLPDGTERHLTPDRRAAIAQENLVLASQALRVLGVARKQGNASKLNGSGVHDLVWLGLVGMADQVRPGVPELLDELHRAGIHTIMLTGDQKATAQAIGERVGLNGHGKLGVINAVDIDGMTAAELVRAAQRAQALSRVNPAQKLRIVRAIQEAGVRVAMVGDGVNDGPALKAADVGVAIGRGGTSPAKEIADVVIDGAELGSLGPAVETGRTTHRNVRKTIRYLVSTNLSEMLVVLAGTSIGMSAPLAPMQLLWINLVTDALPGIGLAMEPPESDVLRQPPGREPAILSRREIGSLAAQAAIMGGASMGAGLFGAARYGLNSPRTRTMTFGSLVIAQLLHAITSRSQSHSVFGGRSRPSNRALSLILGGTAVLQAACLCVPFLRRVLGIAPIAAADALVTLAAGILPFVAMEWTKARRETTQNELMWSRDMVQWHPGQRGA
ncbi:HAD-IC family P-type ATPase [Mesorhizobium sp. BAC0120]|nr:HAD-IC family P-type ATPase [Mesorhizobium sp. BAC0120]